MYLYVCVCIHAIHTCYEVIYMYHIFLPLFNPHSFAKTHFWLYLFTDATLFDLGKSFCDLF